MTLNIASDYSIFDNLETITFQNKGGTAITINNVMRRPSVLGVDDGGGNVVYGAAIEFLIWKSSVPFGFLPKLNATITDNLGKQYTVDSIDDGVLRTRWSIKATSFAGEGVN